jgi:heterodisulfide reductase subunit C
MQEMCTAANIPYKKSQDFNDDTSNNYVDDDDDDDDDSNNSQFYQCLLCFHCNHYSMKNIFMREQYFIMHLAITHNVIHDDLFDKYLINLFII